MIRAVALVALLVGAAHAETVVEVPKSTATLTLDDGWARVTHTFKGVVEIFRHESGANLVLTRADIPNPSAWVADKRQAYVDQVEQGVRKQTPGYKRLARKVVDVNGVPALDLEARRDGGATLVVRVLLFRTYSVSVGIEVPKGSDVARARAVVKTLGPATKQPAAPAATK